MRRAVALVACLLILLFAFPAARVRADQILPSGDSVDAAAPDSVSADAPALAYADAPDSSGERVGELVSDQEAWELPIGIVALVVGLGGLIYWFHSL